VSLGSSSMPESTASLIVWGSCFGVSKEKGAPRGLSNVVNGLPWAVPGGEGALSNSNQGGEGGGLPVEGLFVLGLVTGCFFFFLVVTIVGEGCSSASELSSGDALGSLRILLCAGESLPLVSRWHFKVGREVDGGSTSMVSLPTICGYILLTLIL